MPYLGIFGLDFRKQAIVIFEISTLEFVKKWVFNSYNEFWYKLRFF